MAENSLDGWKCRMGMRVMTLCHSLQYSEEHGFLWTSPEELEFVKFGEKYGFQFQRVNNNATKEEGIGKI